ncbi:MAG: sterol desaturase family protein [Acidobacteria bacterium]|nr:sterol desaturase family protein [Acidobacteriota bacterium]
MKFLGRYYCFWFFPALGILLMSLAMAREEAAGWAFPAVLSFVGLLLWSFSEYVLHRFLFHWRPRAPFVKRLLAQLHFSHHADPRNSEKILIRPIYSIPVSGVLGMLLYFLLGSLISMSALMMGLWLGFIYYEFVHYHVHLSSRTSLFLNRQRRNHFYHHFVNDTCCYGVTSPVWDLILGTRRR